MVRLLSLAGRSRTMDDHGSRPSSTALARGALSRGSKRSDAAGGTSLHVTDSAASRADVLRLRLACGEATLRTNGRGTASSSTGRPRTLSVAPPTAARSRRGDDPDLYGRNS